MMICRITDEMREHMFDNWSEKKLQSMADDEGWTIPELKERLLEFAAFHDIDSLDDFIVDHDDKTDSISQLDGAPMTCDMLNAPRTPTMTSPMSQSSDEAESVFEVGASVFTSPSTPYTPATVRVAENGSPMQRGTTKYNQLMRQIDGLDDLSESHDGIQIPCDGSAIDADGQPITRMFDPKNSLKHRAMDMDFLLDYNSDKKVVHLQGVDPSTGHLQTDPHTLVISVESVVYEDGQAGAAVFFHPMSPWNTVTWVSATKKNAKLEALYIALNMISFTAANDPNLKTVLIRCAGRDFCLANTALEHNLAAPDRKALTQWLQGASKPILSEINELWTDITQGTNGHRAVDVRLWCAREEEMQTVTEMALAYMYEQRGRDWYAENGKTRPDFEVDIPDSLIYLQHNSIVAPRHIVNQGPQAVSRWTAEARARLRQSLLHKAVASDGCRDLNEQLRANEGGLLSMEQFLEAYAMATHYMSEDPQSHIDQFVTDQRAIRLSNQLQGHQMNDVGAEIGSDDLAETLVREVLEMGWEMDWE
jgi:hypothetical protein